MDSEKVEKDVAEDASELADEVQKVWHKPVVQKLDISQTAFGTNTNNDATRYS